MNEILSDLVRRSGIEAAFICDHEANVLASAVSNPRQEDALSTLSSTIVRANTSLSTLKHGSIAEIEWVYKGGRVLVRGMENALLCLICSRSLNLQLLTMTLEDVAGKIRVVLGAKPSALSEREIAHIKEELIAVAEEILGEHAGKVVAILENAGGTLASLDAACEQSVKVTRLFINQNNAAEMDAQMQAHLEAYRSYDGR